jgi:hypothetical protein
MVGEYMYDVLTKHTQLIYNNVERAYNICVA